MSDHPTCAVRASGRTRLMPLLSLALCVGLAGLPGVASAYPAYFDQDDGWGLLQSTAEAAFASGVLHLFVNSVPQAAGQVETVSQVVQSSSIQDNPSHENPNFVVSHWTFQNPADEGPESIENAWLVYFNPQTYDPESDVGFELPNDGSWAIVQVPVQIGESIVDFYYPAVRLGSLADGEQVTFVVRHLAAVDLHRDEQGNMVLPRYGIGLIQSPAVSAPEPAALALVMLIGLSLVATRSRAAARIPS